MNNRELDEQICQELLGLYNELNRDGKLHIGAELQRYYTTFRNKFGPDKLLALDGEELLFTMKGGKEDDSLIHWLDFKNDAEFPPIPQDIRPCW